jgi:hypothetical protein
MTSNDLTHFVEEVCGDSRLRVETDLGDGFVRLRTSEAERRQAAQDIRCNEDIVIELLRNARDAGAHHIFVATQHVGEKRLITVIDDGSGIPASMHEHIFEPRVTSKLDTAHMDKWGMHGRGMALFSISENAERAEVAASTPGLGTSLLVETVSSRLGEKTDQSTFPRFECGEGGACTVRGPKNILRTVAEFALEHRKTVEVYIGSPAEIAATLYDYGMTVLSPAVRAFASQAHDVPLIKTLALATDAQEFTDQCANLALPLSTRSARRIMDGTIAPLESVFEQIASALTSTSPELKASKKHASSKDQRGLKLDAPDIEKIKHDVTASLESLCDAYYLEGVGEPRIVVSSDAIRITVPLTKMS